MKFPVDILSTGISLYMYIFKLNNNQYRKGW